MNYDDKESIAAQLGSYDAFYALITSRSEAIARDDWQSRLIPFTILGRYYSDDRGRCSRLDRDTFTNEDRKMMPSVMTDEEFKAFVDQHVRPRMTDEFFSRHEGISGMAPSFPLPPPHISCFRCGGSWDMDTCHDIDTEAGFEQEDIPATFVGRSLKSIQEDFDCETNIVRTVGPLRKKGERHPIYRIDWNYIVQAGDRVSVYYTCFYHGSCFRQLQDNRLAQEINEKASVVQRILEATGFNDVHMKRVPIPEYLRAWFIDKEEVSPTEVDQIPYYRIKTRQGRLGVVFIHYELLDLTDSGVTVIDLHPEFAEEWQSDEPQMIGFSDEAQMLRLWQLMEKRKKVFFVTLFLQAMKRLFPWSKKQ